MGSPFTALSALDSAVCCRLAQMREPRTEELDANSRDIKYRVNFCGDVPALEPVSQSSFLGVTV